MGRPAGRRRRPPLFVVCWEGGWRPPAPSVGRPPPTPPPAHQRQQPPTNCVPPAHLSLRLRWGPPHRRCCARGPFAAGGRRRRVSPASTPRPFPPPPALLRPRPRPAPVPSRLAPSRLVSPRPAPHVTGCAGGGCACTSTYPWVAAAGSQRHAEFPRRHFFCPLAPRRLLLPTGCGTRRGAWGLPYRVAGLCLLLRDVCQREQPVGCCRGAFCVAVLGPLGAWLPCSRRVAGWTRLEEGTQLGVGGGCAAVCGL